MWFTIFGNPIFLNIGDLVALAVSGSLMVAVFVGCITTMLWAIDQVENNG